MDDSRRCKAKAKGTGTRCKNRVVHGKEVCRIHGGVSPGRPITHGRYSITKRTALREKVEEFRKDPAAGDLRDELAVLRAFLEDYLNRFDDNLNPSGADIMLVYSMVDNIGKLVERIAKILATTALTQAELQLLQVTLIDAISEFIPEPERQRAFISRLGGAFGRSPRAPVGTLLPD